MSVYGKHYLPQRVVHWINLISIIVLVITGFYIHRPFAAGIMGTMRYLHFIAGFILGLNIAVRIYYAFLGKHRDYYEFKLEPAKILEVVRYYVFISPKTKKSGKYNALQKLAYISIPFLIIYQAITGFAIGWPDGRLAGFVAATGGLANLRALHYLGTWVFISITLLHVYALIIEEPKQFWAMFFGKDIGEEQSVTSKQVNLNVQSK